MLGVAGMQTTAMQSGGLAAQRLSVIMKVQEMAERIRMNSAVAITDYNISDANTGANNSCNSSDCTAAEMAEYDVYFWKDDLNTILPGGDSNIDATVIIAQVGAASAVPARGVIAVSWDSPVGRQNYVNTFYVDTTNNVWD
jgi:Tfp pilus assembly protein PilV